MTHATRKSFVTPHGDGLVERVPLARAARGFDLALVAAQEGAELRLTLQSGSGAPVVMPDPLAMVERAEDLDPNHPRTTCDPLRWTENSQAIAQLPVLARLVEHLIRSTDPRDVDLYIHFLRTQIAQLATLLARPASANIQGFSLLELAALPCLWRIDALDRAFETHLLAGHDALRDRLDLLIWHPKLSKVLTSQRLHDWLRNVIAAKGAITDTDTKTDWSAAFGPSANPRPEKTFPRDVRRTKFRSIGSPDRFR
jgi:glutathione S-transferase